jgi:hypothetical protein
MKQFKDRRVRASRRAAAGLSIARLIKRGLLERCSRGRWRLTAEGLPAARRLCPDFKLPTKRKLAGNIALRQAIQSLENDRPAFFGKRRRRTKTSPVPPTSIADFERERPGVEMKLDSTGL